MASGRLVYTAAPKHELPICDVCGEEDYVNPCDACAVAMYERCQYCFGSHWVSEQEECRAINDEQTITGDVTK